MKATLIATGLLGGILGFISPAAAQHGHGHGGHGHGGHGHGGHHHGGHHQGGGSWGHALGHALGFGHSFYDHHHGHGWYGSGHYPSYRYYYPSYNYGYNYGYYPSYGYYEPGYSYGYPAASGSYSAYGAGAYASPLAPDQARLRIILPYPEAELTFNGGKDFKVGGVRVYDLPPLEPGYTYWYKVQATWIENATPVADIRSVRIVPGQLTVVDFTRPAAEESSPPAK